MYNFEYIVIDPITHLPTKNAFCNSIYTVLDNLSKYIYLLPCKATASADELA